MKDLRHHRGALTLETTEARAVFDGDALADLRPDEKNPAKDLIEDFMIAANVATAQFLERHGFPSLRRVLRTPERWDRIVALAKDLGERLPGEPSAPALQEFLARRRKADPTRFADVSLSVVKLLGSGEYAVELPGGSADGHFGLAVRDYTHSTAPNRRFPDLVTQRLVKAAIAGQPLSVRGGAADGAGSPLHAAGGQRREGGAAGAQVGGGAAARPARRRALRRASSPVPRRRGPGCASSTRRWRGAWCAASTASTSATPSAWSWCTPTSSGASSTSPAPDESLRPSGAGPGEAVQDRVTLGWAGTL